MNKTRGLLLTAGFVLATAFTFSCSGDDGGGGGGDPSSSSGGGQGGGNSITHQGKSYKTVKIGDQTWFAENLNYETGVSKCYDNDNANCTKYGRLYDWATAMGLDPSCNTTRCITSNDDAKRKGICPEGWHVSTNADWNELLRYVDNENDGNGKVTPIPELGIEFYESNTAGEYLKATDGWAWNEYRDEYGNGTDNYGFAALPGGYGYGYSDGNFYFQQGGVGGYWWNGSLEDSNNEALIRKMSLGENAGWDDTQKSTLYSIRCIKD